METLRFEQWLDGDEATELFGGPLAQGPCSTRLVDAITLWDHWGQNQTLYLAEAWTAYATLIVVTALPNNTLPVSCDGTVFSYFIEAAIAREFLEDFVAPLPNPPDPRVIAERLVRYATDDA